MINLWTIDHGSGGLPSPDEGLSDEELAQKIQVTGCECELTLVNLVAEHAS